MSNPQTPCFLTSGGVQVEVGVVSWNTALRSSMRPIYSQGHTWFQAWEPNHDSMVMTFRQESPYAQNALIAVLFQWMRTNAVVHIEWAARNMDYLAIIAGAPQKHDYDVVMNDISVTFMLVTNKFIHSTATASISSNVLSMLGDKFVSTTIDDAEKEAALQEQKAKERGAQEKKNLLDKAKAAVKKTSGYKVSYNDDGTATFDFTDYSKPNFTPGGFTQTYPHYRVTVKITNELVDKLNKGDDIPHYLLTHKVK